MIALLLSYQEGKRVNKAIFFTKDELSWLQYEPCLSHTTLSSLFPGYNVVASSSTLIDSSTFQLLSEKKKVREIHGVVTRAEKSIALYILSFFVLSNEFFYLRRHSNFNHIPIDKNYARM
jgi:hypothetical protein